MEIAATADAKLFCTQQPSVAGRSACNPFDVSPLHTPPSPVFWEVKPGFPRFHSLQLFNN